MPTNDLRAAFAPFADGRVVHLPVDRASHKYRAVAGDEFMYMYSDEQGHWLKHRATRNYLLSRRDGTVAVIVGRPGEVFFGGFYGEALCAEQTSSLGHRAWCSSCAPAKVA